MTRDEIDEMAREAGFHAAIGDSDLETFVEWRARTKALERFAKRIAAAERERCAKMFDGEVWAYDYRQIAAAIRRMK